MGSLTPGATYIYEKADGVTYAREFGSSDRFPIGWDYNTQIQLDKKKEDLLWHDIRRAASDNMELQTALERVKIIYYLSIKDGQE
jgi:hypothetical protein